MKNEATNPITVLWWVITIAWAIQIFCLSTETFKPDFSQALLAQALAFLHINVSSSTFQLLHSGLRKLAHLVEYAIFSLLLYSRPGAGGQRYWRPRQAILSILVAAAYSLTDEFHQAFVPGRHASLIDCGLDTSGAALAMLLPYARQQISLHKSNNHFSRRQCNT